MTIALSDEATKQSIASLRRYFDEELDQAIGDLKAGNILEFAFCDKSSVRRKKS